MIDTILGPMDESTLRRVDGSFEDENEYTTWVEYYHRDHKEPIHRSAHVSLKHGIGVEIRQGQPA